MGKAKLCPKVYGTSIDDIEKKSAMLDDKFYFIFPAGTRFRCSLKWSNKTFINNGRVTARSSVIQQNNYIRVSFVCLLAKLPWFLPKHCRGTKDSSRFATLSVQVRFCPMLSMRVAQNECNGWASARRGYDSIGNLASALRAFCNLGLISDILQNTNSGT